MNQYTSEQWLARLQEITKELNALKEVRPDLSDKVFEAIYHIDEVIDDI